MTDVFSIHPDSLGTLRRIIIAGTWLIASVCATITHGSEPETISNDAEINSLDLQFRIKQLLVDGSVSGERGAHDTSAIYIAFDSHADASLKAISMLPEKQRAMVQRLHLDDSKQSEISAKYVHFFPQLRKLHVTGDWNDDWSRHLGSIDLLEELWIQNKHLSNESLVHFCKMKNLRVLNVGGNQFNGKALRGISKLAKLEHLNLSGSQVQDDDLIFLKCLSHLQTLDLSNTHVSDRSLDYICLCKSLHRIHVNNTHFSSRGTRKLRTAFVNAIIIGSDEP